MAKKVLVFLSVVLFLTFVGLWVLYFYSHKQTNKKNSIISFIPSQTEFVLKIQNTSKTTNEFFLHPLVQHCFNLKLVAPIWNSVDSITSRNYKTAEVLSNNTSYICIDSLQNVLVLVDLNKKANDHFIDQFLSTSTSNGKIERFKEGYKAFYPSQKSPMYYFVKQDVFAVSYNQQFLLNSLKNINNSKPDSVLLDWDARFTSSISIWGKGKTESSVLDSFIDKTIFFNGWLSQMTNAYSLEIKWENGKLEFVGECILDSNGLKKNHLSEASSKQSLYLMDNDTDVVVNLYSVLSIDSLGKKNNFTYSYQQFKDSANNRTFLLMADYSKVQHLFKDILKDSLTQQISMADDKITEISVVPMHLVKKILPFIPESDDTTHLFCANYNEIFLAADQTTTVLGVPDALQQKLIVKKTLEKGLILQGEKTFFASTFMSSQHRIKVENGVFKINALLSIIKAD